MIPKGGELVATNGASAQITVAVDAMGGDHAPGEILKGAAAAHGQGTNVVLVGPEEVLLEGLEALGRKLPVVNASEIVSMAEPVSHAMRRQDSSLRVASRLVSAGDAHAVVSCGNSAAIMGIAKREWGDLPGIDRPAFGGFLPSRNGAVFVLDIGANSMVKASNLLQFAVMGDVYVRLTRGIENPRVGLLSNGTEANKGTKEVKEANEALRKLPEINFIGNVEGNQVFEGLVDVVVCDGFAGNILLKGAEGAVSEVFELFRDALSKDLIAKLAGVAMTPAFASIKRRVDYEEYGGVPVLGVNEVMINCHGRSKAKAVMNGILLAERLAREDLTEHIREALDEEEVGVGRRARLARAFHLRHE